MCCSSGKALAAQRAVAMGVGLRPTAKAVDLPPNPNVHAPQIYPDLGQRHIELDRSPQLLAAYSFKPQPKEAAEQVGPACRTSRSRLPDK